MAFEVGLLLAIVGFLFKAAWELAMRRRNNIRNGRPPGQSLESLVAELAVRAADEEILRVRARLGTAQEIITAAERDAILALAPQHRIALA